MPEGIVQREKLCLEIDGNMAMALRLYCLKKYRTTWGINREIEPLIRQFLDRVSPGWDKKRA
jgi:hypothetical protein